MEHLSIQNMLLLAPIFILQLTLMITALVNCIRHDARQLSLPKWMWVIIILLFNYLGPIFYFILGRKK